MISIIITAKDEAKTIRGAVRAFLGQDYLEHDFEIVVVAPDESTVQAAAAMGEKVRILKDAGRGKPAALNLAMREARGEIIILSDGDVLVEDSAVKYLLSKKEMLVSGRPILAEEKDSLLGFWQRVLFETAHELRASKEQAGQYFPVSGYLFMINKKVLERFIFPEESLAEDEYLSYYFWQAGGKIHYEPKAEVRVKGPNNFHDWVAQKVRTLGASYQVPREWQKRIAARSFIQEASEAWTLWKKYGDNFKHHFWLILLFAARLYVWMLALVKIKLLGQKRGQIWRRVESTK